MPETKSQLPAGLRKEVGSTEAIPDDVITELKGQVTTLTDALDSANQKKTTLQAEIEALHDNTKIKLSAVRYAKVFLIVIPICCLILLFFSVNDGLVVHLGEGTRSINWKITVNPYAQAALIVSPIVFIATILGFLLRGVFGQKSETSGITAAEIINIMGSQN